MAYCRPSSQLCTYCMRRLIYIILSLHLLAEILYSSYISPSPKDSNPFLVSEKKEDPTLDIALQALAIETSRRSSSEFTVTTKQALPCMLL